VSKLQEDILNDDVNGFYRTLEGQKLARKMQRKKKRKREGYTLNWDDEYDLNYPNDYEVYVDSDEQLREQIEWQRKLERKPEVEEQVEEEDTGYRGFAPPLEEDWTPPENETEFVPEPVTEVALDESVDEVYARRMRLAQEVGLKIRPPTPPPQEYVPPESPVVEETVEEEVKEVIPSFYEDDEPPKRSAPLQFNFSYVSPPSLTSSAPGVAPSLPFQSATISSAPVHYPTTISSDPVNYTTSCDPVPIHQQADLPRTTLPGQKGFAKRLMQKYGWEKGSSLGPSSQGLVTPLIMKPDNERKGAGFIIDKNKRVEDYGPRGKMSRCIVLWNVVSPGEVDEELLDEIGGECREKVPFPRWWVMVVR
jgi:splicing factor 45